MPRYTIVHRPKPSAPPARKPEYTDPAEAIAVLADIRRQHPGETFELVELVEGEPPKTIRDVTVDETAVRAG